MLLEVNDLVSRNVIKCGIFRSMMTSSGRAYFHRHVALLMAFDGRRRRFWGYAPCTEATRQGTGGMTELIPTVKMETIHPIEGYFGNRFSSICNRCGVMVAWSRKTWKKIAECLHFRGKTTPYGKIFKILSGQFLSRHRWTCRVQISSNLADGKSVNSGLLTWQKNSPRCPSPSSARIAPKICRGQPQTVYSECSRFHPNRFTFGEVISERVNTVKTRLEVDLMFDWSLAWSRIEIEISLDWLNLQLIPLDIF